MSKRGSLEVRLSRLEGAGLGDCPVCAGRSGPFAVYVERDGVCRSLDGTPRPTGEQGWTCSGCGTFHRQRTILIRVEGTARRLHAEA